MGRRISCFSCALALPVLIALLGSAGATDLPPVRDPENRAIRSLGADGKPVMMARPSARGRAVTEQNVLRPPVGILPVCPLAAATPAPGQNVRESRHPGYVVDPCGLVHPEAGYTGYLPPAYISRGSSILGGVTIDSMSIGNYYYDGYTPFNGLGTMGSARIYYLSNGTTWSSGAGYYRSTRSRLSHVEVDGTTVRYFLIPPPDSVLYEQTDFDSGDHSAQGVLEVAGPMVLEATIGSSTAVLEGLARVASNDMTGYGEPRFNFYSALVGAVVPYTIRYTLSAGAWTATTMDGSFDYNSSGSVDFTHPVSSPPLLSIEIRGPAQVPDRSTAQYVSVATFEGDVQRDVTSAAQWSVSPASLASVSAGQLITNALPTSQADLALEVAYTHGGVTRQAQMTVVCRADLFVDATSSWPTYQANASHDGYLPRTFLPDRFAWKWSVDVGYGAALNPVSAAEGRVFASTNSYFGSGDQFFALDARDGHVMWSKGYAAFSVNPPAAAYGNVYIQTCNHSTDTWLHCYDAATGHLVFDAPHAAQWERYFAPTPFAGKIYVDGGYYGGSYAFDALSGNQEWFQYLPQYDEWTPAVDSSYVYAYVGEYNPGLYVMRRSDGSQVFMIPDAEFDWNGWSMDLAPALGPHHDLVAIHNGRLIRFDLSSRLIAWQKRRSFEGQPSIAHDQIYAIDGGRLVVLDEVTGDDRWSWTPAHGSLSGTMIVTDSHLFASSEDSVYAIGLDSHRPAWSYPASGKLAIGNGQLYVAAPTGVLTAIEVPDASAPTIHANAGPDTSVECAGGSGTAVRLDGTRSTGDGLTFAWSAAGVVFDDPASPTPTGLFPLGASTVSLRVTKGGEASLDSVVVTVADSQAPTLGVALTPMTLWPPNHKMIAIHATVTARDGCDPAPEVRLTRVTSSEPDGLHSPDIDGAETGTADFDFQLRAEREGIGHGRFYTVCYEALDDAGHRVEACQVVTVPHDQSGRASLRVSGAHWLITLYGSPTHDVHTIQASSVSVWSDDVELFHASAAPAELADQDHDGAVDVSLVLEGGGAGGLAGTGIDPYVFWRASGTEYVAPLAGQAPLDVEPAAVAFAAKVAANPSRREAVLTYGIPQASSVRLRVFDVAGRRVATLVDGPTSAGRHAAAFRATGKRPGVQLYLYRLEWEGKTLSGKFVVTD